MRISLFGIICGMVLLNACCRTVDPVEPILNQCITMQSIEAGGQIVYLTKKQYWNTASMADERIVFTKSISSGSGGYSVYKTGQLLTQLPTTYEFICDGNLYGYNAWNWKFYKIDYDKSVQKFYTVELKQKEMQKLFEGIEIIPVSQAKDNKVVINVDTILTANVLVWNDTERDFYRYSFEDGYQAKSPFNSLINIQDDKVLTYSHFGEDNETYPALTIEIE